MFGLPLSALGYVLARKLLTAHQAALPLNQDWPRSLLLSGLALLGLWLSHAGLLDLLLPPRSERGPVTRVVHERGKYKGTPTAATVLEACGRRWYLPGTSLAVEAGEEVEVVSSAGSQRLLSVRALERDP